MKKITLLFIFISSFIWAQMPNISSVWLNGSQPYIGTIGKEKTPLKVRIAISEQDRKKDQEYFVAGYSVVENVSSKFEGKIIITKYKDSKKRGTVFGEYDFAEEPKGKHSGTMKGKFIYTFKWNHKTEKIESQHIEFIGDWKSYDGTLVYTTNFKNN